MAASLPLPLTNMRLPPMHPDDSDRVASVRTHSLRLLGVIFAILAGRARSLQLRPDTRRIIGNLRVD
jgi:hypothetical protein